MDRKFVKGGTPKENIDSIDLILQAWAPQLGTHIVGVIPPVPILHRQLLPEADGTILKILLPFSGEVVAAYISIGKYNTKPATIDVWASGGAKLGGTRFVCDKPLHMNITNHWQVVASCLLEAIVDPPDAIEDINIGILIHVKIEQAYKEQQLLEGLKQLEQAHD